MNKSELINAISEATGIQKTTVSVVVSGMHEAIAINLAKGDIIRIAGFGTFYGSKREARKGRNPRNGEVVDIPAKTVPRFRPGKTLKANFNA